MDFRADQLLFISYLVSAFTKYLVSAFTNCPVSAFINCLVSARGFAFLWQVFAFIEAQDQGLYSFPFLFLIPTSTFFYFVFIEFIS
jgi:hypothetical protein